MTKVRSSRSTDVRVRCGIGALVGLVLGSLAAWGVWSTRGGDGEPHLPPTGDRLEAAIAGVRADGVYVPPDGRFLLSEGSERRLEAQVATTEPRTVIIAWAPTTNAGYDSVYAAADQIATRVNPNGVTIIWQGPHDGDVETPLGWPGSSLDFEGDPETRLSEFLTSIDGEEIEPSSEKDTDVVGPILAGAVLGGAAYVALMLIVGFLRLGRRQTFLVPGPFAWPNNNGLEHKRGLP